MWFSTSHEKLSKVVVAHLGSSRSVACMAIWTIGGLFSSSVKSPASNDLKCCGLHKTDTDPCWRGWNGLKCTDLEKKPRFRMAVRVSELTLRHEYRPMLVQCSLNDIASAISASVEQPLCGKSSYISRVRPVPNRDKTRLRFLLRKWP